MSELRFMGFRDWYVFLFAAGIRGYNSTNFWRSLPLSESVPASLNQARSLWLHNKNSPYGKP